jgi:hypothetical protein
MIYMKAMQKILKLTCSSYIVMATFTGCLKDEDFDTGRVNLNVDKNAKVVEVRGPIIGSYGQVLEFSTGDTTVDLVTVNIASMEPASEDIKVTFAVDNSVITEYNDRAGANFTLLPASNFTFPAMEVTIPKGSREAVLKGTIKDPSFLSSGTYALGVKIASVSNPDVKVSGNYGKQVIALRVKNKYHGTYDAKGVFTHPTAGARDIDEEKELTTEEPNSVKAPLGDLGAAGYEMILTVNPDNTVTVAPWGATPNIDQKWGPNFYDPATESFHLHYSYNAAAPRIVKEVITRK